MKIYFPLVLLALSFFACKYEDCEDIKEGEVTMSPSTRSFAPYAEGQGILLKNEAGESFELQNKLDTSPSSICTEYICDVLRDPYSGGNCRYIEAESIRNVLTSSAAGNDVLVEILATFEQYEEESERSYEFVRISFSSGEGFISELEHFITEVNFADIPFDEEKISIDDFLEEKESVELLGQTFSNVLVTNEDSNNMAYLQAEKGLIALKLDGVVWLVQD